MKCWYRVAVNLLVVSVYGVVAMPAQGEQDRQVEEHIAFLLMVEDDETGEYWAEIVGYGERALPVFERILSTPQDDELGELRISRVLSSIHRGFGDIASNLRSHVEAQLIVDSRMIRRQAVPALVAIGGPEVLPTLVAMLYDPDSMVRHQAVTALGELGDESVLLALQIWHKQAAEADESRPDGQKWIDPAMPRRFEEATAAIRSRIDSKD